MKHRNRLLNVRFHPYLPVVLGIVVLTLGIGNGAQIMQLTQSFSTLTTTIGGDYGDWLVQHHRVYPLLLPLLAFVGGVVSSISPCILTLLPINISYIGTQASHSRWDATLKATAFVTGVITVLSLLGLITGFASIVFIQYRGFLQISVGLVVMSMGTNLIGMVMGRINHWRIPTGTLAIPLCHHSVINRKLHTGLALLRPYGVGVTFSLIGSPCASPVLFSVLTVGAASGSPWLSTLTMLFFAIGYTIVIFISSIFTGLVKHTRYFLNRGSSITKIANWLFLFIGLTHFIDGSYWVIARWASI